MRIAYLILAHHQPKHVGALIEQLDDGNARFFVHVDRKSDIAPFRQAIKSQRAELLVKRVPIYWGGWNMVRATLNLLRHAHRQGASDYYQLLSDSCYPIKSNREIAAKLGSGNLNYITINEELTPESRFYQWLGPDRTDRELISRIQDGAPLQIPGLDRYAHRVVKFARRQRDRFFKRRLGGAMTPCKGWQWWCLTHECTQYVLNYVDSHRDFVRFFRSTSLPDETFFHTIIANSKFNQTLSPGFAQDVIAGNHYIRWSKGSGLGKPSVLKEDMLATLVSSEACFARKLRETESDELIRLLRERMAATM